MTQENKRDLSPTPCHPVPSPPPCHSKRSEESYPRPFASNMRLTGERFFGLPPQNDRYRYSLRKQGLLQFILQQPLLTNLANAFLYFTMSNSRIIVIMLCSRV